jgi:hypothetical protein
VRAIYASQSLASGNLALGAAGPFDMSVNGQQVVDEVEFFRALRKAYIERGLRSVDFGFSVTRFFGTLARAEAFFLTGYNDLPDTGDLVLVCGEGEADELNVGLIGAVLDSADASRLQGTAVVVRYRFRGGAFTTDVILGPEPDESVIRKNKVAIADAATSVAVVFSSPMSGVPVVTCNLLMPTTGGDSIFATPIEDTITAAGFTAAFSGPVPSASYKLSYIAIS